MKKLFFSLMFLVGMAWAETDDHMVKALNITQEQIKLLNEKDRILLELIERGNKPDLCPNGWEKSEYYLEHDFTQEELGCQALLMTNCTHKVQKVEICSDNGLIRVKP